MTDELKPCDCSEALVRQNFAKRNDTYDEETHDFKTLPDILLRVSNEKRQSYLTLHYCPVCGNKLPVSSRQ